MIASHHCCGQRRRVIGAAVSGLLMFGSAASAYSLWSDAGATNRSGELILPSERVELGEMTIRNLLLVGPGEWLVPFNQVGGDWAPPCLPSLPTSDASAPRVNGNVQSCVARSSLGPLSVLVVDGGSLQGNLIATINEARELTLSAEVVILRNATMSVRAPLYATTGFVNVPESLRKGIERIERRHRGIKISGRQLRGRLGDADADGWIDGTLIAAGTLPAGLPEIEGVPFLLIRHFETDLPVGGVLSGNVEAMRRAASRERK